MTALWPWLALAGLGMFHGINPAMGWLFAVALGLHRHSRRVVLLSLAPMALGHALSISVVGAAWMLLGVVIDHRLVYLAAGVILIAWAIYHWRYGHRHRVRVGMRTGFAGLTLWSFLMATAHGAGVMLVPALVPLCLADNPAREITASGSLLLALAAVGVHTAAMLVTTAVIATGVCRGVAMHPRLLSGTAPRQAWTAALAVTGVLLMALR
jgi:hypothetical protein